MNTVRFVRRPGALSGLGALALACSLSVACAGAADSQVKGGDDGGGGGGSGSGGDQGSSGGTSSGGASSGSGGGGTSSGGSGGGASSSSGSTSSGGDGGACAGQSNLTLAANVTIAVTWPATTAGNGGSGNVHIWLLSKFAANGNALTGTSQTCGLSLPDLSLNGLGSIAAGGSKVQIQIVPGVWAKPSMPTFASTASQTGWGAPNGVKVDPTLAVIGLALPSGADPGGMAWPSSTWSFPSGTTFPDADGDGNPAITATPLDGNGYVFPPTAVGLGGSAPSADQVYVVSRNLLSLSGTWTSCTDQSGTADVMKFDNHVVGCHIHGGATCSTGGANTQADFLDQNRTIYKPGNATFVAKTLPDAATCADALAALP
jgi:hypothetical protein